MKNEIYRGQKIFFHKKYKFISKDYPASPVVHAIILDYSKNEAQPEEKVIADGFTKAEAFENAKRWIDSRRYDKKFDKNYDAWCDDEPYKYVTLRNGDTLSFDTEEDYNDWVKRGRP